MAETAEKQRRRGPYPKGQRRRQEILDRALGVFTERGFEGTSLRAIGEAIGVTHAALLHYFPSKEALLIEVLKERDARAPRVEENGRYFDYLIRVAEHNASIPGLIALYTSLLGTSVEPENATAREFFAERFARSRQEFRDHLVTEEAGTIRVDPDKLASLIVAAFDGLQIQWLLDPSIDIAGTLDLLRVFTADSGDPAGKSNSSIPR